MTGAPGAWRELRLALRNSVVICPVHALAAEHRELVCGMNLALIEGIVEGARGPGVRPVLPPRPGFCCVSLRLGFPLADGCNPPWPGTRGRRECRRCSEEKAWNVQLSDGCNGYERPDTDAYRGNPPRAFVIAPRSGNREDAEDGRQRESQHRLNLDRYPDGRGCNNRCCGPRQNARDQIQAHFSRSSSRCEPTAASSIHPQRSKCSAIPRSRRDAPRSRFPF